MPKLIDIHLLALAFAFSLPIMASKEEISKLKERSILKAKNSKCHSTIKANKKGMKLIKRKKTRPEFKSDFYRRIECCQIKKENPTLTQFDLICEIKKISQNNQDATTLANKLFPRILARSSLKSSDLRKSENQSLKREIIRNLQLNLLDFSRELELKRLALSMFKDKIEKYLTRVTLKLDRIKKHFTKKDRSKLACKNFTKKRRRMHRKNAQLL